MTVKSSPQTGMRGWWIGLFLVLKQGIWLHPHVVCILRNNGGSKLSMNQDISNWQTDYSPIAEARTPVENYTLNAVLRNQNTKNTSFPAATIMFPKYWIQGAQPSIRSLGRVRKISFRIFSENSLGNEDIFSQIGIATEITKLKENRIGKNLPPI